MRMSLYAFIELWVLARLFFKEKTPAFLLGLYGGISSGLEDRGHILLHHLSGCISPF